jgi:hypothetical protein
MTTGVRSGWMGDRSKKLYCHTTKIEQMIACLLAEIRTIQEHLEEEMRTNQDKVDAN